MKPGSESTASGRLVPVSNINMGGVENQNSNNPLSAIINAAKKNFGG